jgi:hypothetical protein
LAWRRTWTTVDLPPSMASRGAGKTGGAGGGGGGGCGSLGGLPRRCHVPQCMPTLMPTLHEGQGEGKDGDGRTPLITSACSNKHHPVSQAQVRPPFAPLQQRQPFHSGRRNMQSQAASRSAFAVHSYHAHSVPIILFIAVVDRDGHTAARCREAK